MARLWAFIANRGDYISDGRGCPLNEIKIALHTLQPHITHHTVIVFGSVAMLIRLTHKLAECLDGVDLSHRSVDEIFELSLRDAELLIAEGWATPVSELPSVGHPSSENPVRTEAADVSRRLRTRRT